MVFLELLRDLSIALVRRHEEEKQLESFTAKVWKRGLELELELLKIGRASTTNMARGKQNNSDTRPNMAEGLPTKILVRTFSWPILLLLLRLLFEAIQTFKSLIQNRMTSWPIMLFNSPSISCVGRPFIDLTAFPASPPPFADFNANAHSDNPNNFPTAHRRPQANDMLEFIPRTSNTLTQSGGMALMKNGYGGIFLGWVRQGQIGQITTRMSQIIPVQGRITVITRTYQYQGNTCSKSRVDVF